MNKYPGVKPAPKKMYFKYPNGKVLRGTVVDEVFAPMSVPGGDYLFVIQKIISPDRPRKTGIRFGYYRKEKNEKVWRWGSQTTFHTDKGTTEKILRKAVARGLLAI
jgi:hypothetical protein